MENRYQVFKALCSNRDKYKHFETQFDLIEFDESKIEDWIFIVIIVSSIVVVIVIAIFMFFYIRLKYS